VVGGLPGEFLKVGAGGLLDQSAIVPGGAAIGSAVAGGTSPAVLFVGAGGVLAQDPVYFGYDAVGHTVLRKGIAPTTVMEHWDTGVVGAAPFEHVLGGALFGGAWDPVAYFGWNMANQVPTKGQVSIQLEGYFQSAPGVFQQELHMTHTQRNGVNPVRWLSFSGNEDPASLLPRTVLLRASLIQFLDDVTPTQTLQFLNGNLNLQGGGSYIQGVNNLPAILQLNVAGTQFRELLKLDAADQGRLFRGLSDWYGNSNQPGAAMRVGIVNDAGTGTPNAAELWLHPIGGSPGYTVASVVSGYSPGDGTNRTGLLFRRRDAVLYTVLDLRLDGSVALTPQAAQAVPLLDLSAAAALPSLKLPKTAIVPLGALARFKVQDETGAVFYLTGQAA
jgi:hypothetical protein